LLEVLELCQGNPYRVDLSGRSALVIYDFQALVVGACREAGILEQCERSTIENVRRARPVYGSRCI